MTNLKNSQIDITNTHDVWVFDGTSDAEVIEAIDCGNGNYKITVNYRFDGVNYETKKVDFITREGYRPCSKIKKYGLIACVFEKDKAEAEPVIEAVSEVEPTVAKPEPQKLSSFNEGDTVSLNIRDNIWQTVMVMDKRYEDGAGGVYLIVTVQDEALNKKGYGGDYFKAIGLNARDGEVSSEAVSEVEVEMVSPVGKKFAAVARVEGDSYVVKTSMREVKFSKKTMKATGKFAGWRLALINPKVDPTQLQTAKTQRVNPDLFEAYQKAVTEFEAANEEYMQAESQWLKTGKWPDDKRDAGKVRESALDAKKVASDNYYNLN